MVVRKLSQGASSLRSGKSQGVSFHCSIFKFLGAAPGQEKCWIGMRILFYEINDKLMLKAGL